MSLKRSQACSVKVSYIAIHQCALSEPERTLELASVGGDLTKAQLKPISRWLFFGHGRRLGNVDGGRLPI
jgi:hypothetical protein